MARQGALGQLLVLAAPQGAMGLQQEARLESMGELEAPLGALKLRPELKAQQGVLGLGQLQLGEGLQGKLLQMQMLRP